MKEKEKGFKLESGPLEPKDYQDTNVIETLNFDLTESELADCAILAADLAREYKAKSDEFKGVKESYKGDLSNIESKLVATYSKIENGEDREIECIKRVFFETKEVAFIHDGKILKKRPMQAGENQLSIDGSVPEENFASETDAIDAGMKGEQKDTLQEAVEKEAESRMADEDEVVTEETLTSNTPVDF